MATSGCAPVKFFCISETAFYFEEAVEIDGGVDEDAFRMSSYPAAQKLVRSKTNKFLILTVEEQFVLKNLTTEQKCQPEYKFNIKTYNNNAFDGRTGRAVMLYANKGGKKVVVCCNENHEIHPVEMDLPQQIEESGHKAVFYKKQLPKSNYLLLESSLYPTEFLGFQPDEQNQTLSKLVLFPKGEDEVDERCEFSISVDE